MVISPIASQPSPASWRLMIRGVTASACGMAAIACLKWALFTWSPAASSLKASTRTNSLGSSTLRDQSNHRLPGSWRVASVKSATRPSHLSDQSGLTLNLTTMNITGLCLSLGFCVLFGRQRLLTLFNGLAGVLLLGRGSDALGPLLGQLELHERLRDPACAVQGPAQFVVQRHHPALGPLVVDRRGVLQRAAGPDLRVGG